MAQSFATPDQRDTREGGPILLVGSRYGTVAALQADTGALLWRWTPGPRLGTLAHGGEVVYVPTNVPLPARKTVDVSLPGGRHHTGQILGHPALLTALRARDGVVLWQKEGWRTPGSTHLVLDSGLLFADAPAPEIGSALVHALDARTGEVRWTYGAGAVPRTFPPCSDCGAGGRLWWPCSPSARDAEASPEPENSMIGVSCPVRSSTDSGGAQVPS